MTTPSAGAARKLILVVEDEPLLRLLAAEILVDEGGYSVIEAGDADEAVACLKARADIGVVVTDVSMPGRMDGFALARLIARRWPGIRVVVTSGRLAPRVDDLPPGADFLAKPYSPAALLQAVEAACRRVPAKAPDAVVLPM